MGFSQESKCSCYFFECKANLGARKSEDYENTIRAEAERKENKKEKIADKVSEVKSARVICDETFISLFSNTHDPLKIRNSHKYRGKLSFRGAESAPRNSRLKIKEKLTINFPANTLFFGALRMRRSVQKNGKIPQRSYFYLQHDRAYHISPLFFGLDSALSARRIYQPRHFSSRIFHARSNLTAKRKNKRREYGEQSGKGGGGAQENFLTSQFISERKILFARFFPKANLFDV